MADIQKGPGVDLYCKCGSYLGKVMPGYVKVVQCFCGELITVSKPSQADLKETSAT